VQEVLENPTSFDKPFQLEITFECLQELHTDLEWKVIYVGSAESSSYDQILEELLVGPVPMGVNKFILEAQAPDIKLIPSTDLLGMNVISLCSFVLHHI
jgi:histone chaperone ASF1